jgi:hypothetical protein
VVPEGTALLHFAALALHFSSSLFFRRRRGSFKPGFSNIELPIGLCL